MKQRVHFTDQYLLSPTHPVTVNLVGAGGTGSRVLTHLASLDSTLRALGHPGLQVTVWDPDHVTEANFGRQLFSASEIGLNKTACLVSRVNSFFGNGWRAVPGLFPETLKELGHSECANITLTCTDNIKSRLDMDKVLTGAAAGGGHYEYMRPVYWMDFGNTKTAGQVVMGTLTKPPQQPKSRKFEAVSSLKTITQTVEYSRVETKESGPSCSQAEALAKQDLFINSTLAVFGCDILWKLFRHGRIEHNGAFVNLDTMRVNPICV